MSVRPPAARAGVRAAPLRSEAGIALLLAVWLLAVLGVLAGEFVFSSRVKAAAERNQRDALRARALALAGYRSAVAALDAQVTAVSLDEGGRLLLHYAGEAAGTPAEAKDVPLGDGTYSWRIEDLDGRVNVNDPKRPVLGKLLEAVGVPLGAERDTIVDSLLDWEDANREHRLNGAEEDYYRSLDPPYSAKDGPLDAPEELLLLRGMKEKYFTGWEEEGKRYPGLRDLVTTISGGFRPATAPQAVLDALQLTRPAQPAPPSRVFAVTASGKTRGLGLERTVRAVLRRDAQGSRMEFTLVYWNDNCISGTNGEGAAP